MKSAAYRIVFVSELGKSASFVVRAACMGNAIASAWCSLEDKFGSTKGWAVSGRFVV